MYWFRRKRSRYSHTCTAITVLAIRAVSLFLYAVKPNGNTAMVQAAVAGTKNSHTRLKNHIKNWKKGMAKRNTVKQQSTESCACFNKINTALVYWTWRWLEWSIFTVAVFVLTTEGSHIEIRIGIAHNNRKCATNSLSPFLNYTDRS